MSRKIVLVLYLCIASVFSAPMQLQVLPLQYGNGIQTQMPFLKQMFPNLQSPVPNVVPNLQMPMYTQQPVQPLVIILPNAAPNPETDDRYVNLNEQDGNIHLKSNTGHIDEHKDAVVIDANPKPLETQPKNALVYLPDEGRYSLGQIITYIPFLPIEINVPDTISWITHILTGGLFRPMGNAKSGLNNKGSTPIIVMPYPGLPQV